MQSEAGAQTNYIPKALLRPQRKPFIIRAAPLLLIIYGLVTGLFAILMAIESGDGSVSVGDVPISAAQTRWIVTPVMIAESIFVLILAYGFLAERRWTRNMTTYGLPGAYVLSVASAAIVTGWSLHVLAGPLPGLVVILALVWYFSRSAAVRTYYQNLGA